MNNTTRYIIAGVLIFLIILLQPIYLKWLGYDSGYDFPEQDAPVLTFSDSHPEEDVGKIFDSSIHEDGSLKASNNEESFVLRIYFCCLV